MTGKRRALVTGATGVIGPVLVSHLLESGYQVRTLNRRKVTHATIQSEVEQVVGSITDPEAVSQALTGIDTVFHLAALLHIENPPPDMFTQYQKINVEGTRLLAQQASELGVRRFIYFSTVKVYGTHQRQPVTEDQPPLPQTLYARSKYMGEQAVNDIGGLDATTLRLSPVYGPRVKGSWARLIHAIERGRFLPVGSLTNVHSLTHVEDVVRAAILVAEHPGDVTNVYNLVGHETPTLAQILDAIYNSCGKRLPSVRIPTPIALAGAYTLEKLLGGFGKRSPLPVDALRQLVEDEAYSSAKLQLLGFAPEVKLSEGWSQATVMSARQ